MLEAVANFVGKDGFNWWVGQVENDGSGHYWTDLAKNAAKSAVATSPLAQVTGFASKVNTDWDWTNKVKVRIMGYHNPSKNELPTDDLPWAMVMMPVTHPQKSGIGSLHQLQINSWVVGFFMDGSSAQIPIVMGAIGDENPQGTYGTEGGTDQGYAQLSSPSYDERVHGGDGTTAPGTGNTISTDPETGNTIGSTDSGGNQWSSTSSTNERGADEQEGEHQKEASKKKCVTVQVGNGKCGSETATKLEAPLSEFMKFARGIEKNSIDQFIDKATGSVVDLEKEISRTTKRIQAKLTGLTGNIKGVVMHDVNKLVQKGLDDINIPNPDLDNAVKEQLKDVGGLVSCLFKQLLGELGDFIKGMLNDLLENVLDTALCLIQDLIGSLMDKVMEKIKAGLAILQGVVGSIKGAADKIQGLMSKILDFIDLFCDGELSCAIGASTFETCHGAKASGNEATQKNIDQYPVKPPNFGTVVGDGVPKNGFVPFVDKIGTKKVFDTKSGSLVDLLSPEGIASGVGKSAFGTKGPLEKFEGINFYGSDGEINRDTVNCANSILNKKPCFPEMVWDNLKSTTPVKALPIIDDIGAIVGVFMRRKGTNVNREAQVRAQFTCNEPEGGGARLKPIIKEGIVDSVQVLDSGIGYGFDPADTYCPKEQYAAKVKKSGLIQHVDDGDLLMLVETAAGVKDETTPDILQVVDTDYDTDHILIATIDPKYTTQFEIGMKLKTKSGHEFVLNFDYKFPELIVPTSAKAVYANCGDLIPIIDSIQTANVGKGYVNPIITIGTGPSEQIIGEYTVDDQGRLVEPKITKKVLGFVSPKIRDVSVTASGERVPGRGTGAIITPTYGYSGPRKIKESNILTLQTYIDCVGHPDLT
tara:strand:- start:396 stop:3008 length:2613 start_codon:yes stop_codon:yes gene_type:complete